MPTKTKRGSATKAKKSTAAKKDIAPKKAVKGGSWVFGKRAMETVGPVAK